MFDLVILYFDDYEMLNVLFVCEVEVFVGLVECLCIVLFDKILVMKMVILEV